MRTMMHTALHTDRLLAMAVVLTSASVAGGAPVHPLPTMLSIDWQRLPDMLHPAQLGAGGFQNSDGGWVTPDTVVTAFGHGPGLPGRSHFLNQTYLLNVTAALATPCRGSGYVAAAATTTTTTTTTPTTTHHSHVPAHTRMHTHARVEEPLTGGAAWHGAAPLLSLSRASCRHGCGGEANASSGVDFLWQRLPDAPATGRQDVAATTVGTALFILGGFSYTPPYTFADFLKLSPASPPAPAPAPAPATASKPRGVVSGPRGAPSRVGVGVGPGPGPVGLKGGGWGWEALPRFPYPVSMHQVASIGSVVFVQVITLHARRFGG